jgi:hypothetical protein
MYTFANIDNAPSDAEFGLGLLERLATRAKADIATTGNVLKDLVTRQAWTDPNKRSSYENLNEGYRQANDRVKDAFQKAEANSLAREMGKTASDTSLRDIRTGEAYKARTPPVTEPTAPIVASSEGGALVPQEKGGFLATKSSRRGLLGKAAGVVAATAAGGLIPAKQAIDTATLAKSGRIGDAIGKAKDTATSLGYAAKIPMALDKMEDIATNPAMSRRKFLQKYGLVLKEAAGQMYPKTTKVLETITQPDAISKAALRLAKKYSRGR